MSRFARLEPEGAGADSDDDGDGGTKEWWWWWCVCGCGFIWDGDAVVMVALISDSTARSWSSHSWASQCSTVVKPVCGSERMRAAV